MKEKLNRWFWKKLGYGETTISAKVIRKDGSVEDLGVVSRGRVKLKTRRK